MQNVTPIRNEPEKHLMEEQDQTLKRLVDMTNQTNLVALGKILAHCRRGLDKSMLSTVSQRADRCAVIASHMRATVNDIKKSLDYERKRRSSNAR